MIVHHRLSCNARDLPIQDLTRKPFETPEGWKLEWVCSTPEANPIGYILTTVTYPLI